MTTIPCPHSRKEHRFANFPFASFRSIIFYKETFHFSSRNLRIEDFADSKLRPLSFLSRTGNLLQALRLWNFCVLIFLYENCLQKFSASSSAVFSRHSLTQFSNRSFLIRLQISFVNLPSQISILASQICLFPQSLQCVQEVIQVSCSLPSQFFEARCIHGVAAIVTRSVVYEGY